MTQFEFFLSAIDFQTIISNWTFKVSTAASYTTNVAQVLTLAIDTTGCNLIVVNTGGFDVPINLTDNKSNTWTLVTDLTSGGRNRMYYCLSPNVGTGHTFKVEQPSGSGYYGNLHVMGFQSGTTTQAYNYQTSEIRTFGAANRYFTASIAGLTPSANGSLFVVSQMPDGFLGNGLTQGSVNMPAEWTKELYSKNASTITNYTWYLIQGTASAINATFSFATASRFVLTGLNNFLK